MWTVCGFIQDDQGILTTHCGLKVQMALVNEVSCAAYELVSSGVKLGASR